MARLARDGDLDLHAAALAAVDAERPLGRVAGPLRQDHGVGDQLRRRSRQDLPHQVLRPAAVVVLLGDRPVGTDDRAGKRPLRRELEQDLRRHDLRHDAGELVGRAAPEDEVVPLRLGGHVSELALDELAVEPAGVEEPVVRIDAAGLLPPRAAERVDRVGMPVPVDDALPARRDAVGLVLHGPDEVPVAVVPHVLRPAHAADLDQGALHVLEPRLLVVRQPAARIPAVVRRPVHVVRRNPDDLLQDPLRHRPVARRQLRDPPVEIVHSPPPSRRPRCHPEEPLRFQCHPEPLALPCHPERSEGSALVASIRSDPPGTGSARDLPSSLLPAEAKSRGRLRDEGSAPVVLRFARMTGSNPNPSRATPIAPRDP